MVVVDLRVLVVLISVLADDGVVAVRRLLRAMPSLQRSRIPQGVHMPMPIQAMKTAAARWISWRP